MQAELMAPCPGIKHHCALSDMPDLFNHIELNQSVVALTRVTGIKHRLMTVTNILNMPEPVIGKADARRLKCGQYA